MALNLEHIQTLAEYDAIPDGIFVSMVASSMASLKRFVFTERLWGIDPDVYALNLRAWARLYVEKPNHSVIMVRDSNGNRLLIMEIAKIEGNTLIPFFVLTREQQGGGKAFYASEDEYFELVAAFYTARGATKMRVELDTGSDIYTALKRVFSQTVTAIDPASETLISTRVDAETGNTLETIEIDFI